VSATPLFVADDGMTTSSGEVLSRKVGSENPARHDYPAQTKDLRGRSNRLAVRRMITSS
jgi:hypothetical protein